MKIFLHIGCFILLATTYLWAQQASPLTLDRPETFQMSPNGEREFRTQLKADEFIDIAVLGNSDLGLVLLAYSPEGRKIFEEDASDSVPFVAPRGGEYKLVVTSRANSEAVLRSGSQRVTIRLGTRFVPKKNILKGSKVVNGYTIKILDEVAEDGSTYVVVSKDSRLKALLKRPKGPYAGFYFKDNMKRAYGPAEKKSAALFASTPDVTGDGIPDVAIEYFSGGAHCCTEIAFIELGPEVKQIGPIYTANDSLTAIDKRQPAGLVFAAAEQAFAYWLVSYADSPMPLIIYELKDGELVPNLQRMKKPAPSFSVLQRKANDARHKIGNEPYTGEEGENDFVEAFWGEMLNLVYTGHEELAWQYFDMVWPAGKRGKELFLADFKKRILDGLLLSPPSVDSSSRPPPPVQNASPTNLPLNKMLVGTWRVPNGDNGAPSYLRFVESGGNLMVSPGTSPGQLTIPIPVALKDGNFSFSQVVYQNGVALTIILTSLEISGSSIMGVVQVTSEGRTISTGSFRAVRVQ